MSIQGNRTTSSATITIDDVPPSGTPPGILVAASGGYESSTLSMTGNWYDPNGGPGNRNVDVNWGDGTVETLSLPSSFTVRRSPISIATGGRVIREENLCGSSEGEA